MGGGPLCREDGDKAVWELLDTFYALGGNIIDSANVYGKWLPGGRNACDANIGKWLKRTGLRGKVIVASKGAHPPLADMGKPRLKKADVEADLDESLRALGTDAIDLYYLHRDDTAVPVRTIVDYLNDFARRGKIRYFGASNWAPERIAEAQRYAEQTGQAGFAANQLMWSLAVPDAAALPDPLMECMGEKAMRYHRESGMAAFAYESQARGLFQKYAESGSVPQALQKVYHSPENGGRCARAASLARDLGVKIGDVSLGYVLCQPFPSVAIIGGHTPEQLRDSATAADICLTEAKKEFLEGGL
jgi:aryl-alcohol dehydrogenase-like predicted oxidoreductase